MSFSQRTFLLLLSRLQSACIGLTENAEKGIFRGNHEKRNFD